MQMQTSGEALCHVEGGKKNRPGDRQKSKCRFSVGQGIKFSEHKGSLVILCFVFVSVFCVMTAIIVSRGLDRCFLIPGTYF